MSLADDLSSDDSRDGRGNMEEDEMHQAILASLLEYTSNDPSKSSRAPPSQATGTGGGLNEEER